MVVKPQRRHLLVLVEVVALVAKVGRGGSRGGSEVSAESGREEGSEDNLSTAGRRLVPGL